ncbi:hypothetical protein [Streptomyces sp. NPDC058394]|uniref:hypothetical protein n=1 Tax=Streptomyces sp. NPDC058394 TaxID=3346477 RepID=UPI00365A154F
MPAPERTGQATTIANQADAITNAIGLKVKKNIPQEVYDVVKLRKERHQLDVATLDLAHTQRQMTLVAEFSKEDHRLDEKEFIKQRDLLNERRNSEREDLNEKLYGDIARTGYQPSAFGFRGINGRSPKPDNERNLPAHFMAREIAAVSRAARMYIKIEQLVMENTDLCPTALATQQHHSQTPAPRAPSR